MAKKRKITQNYMDIIFIPNPSRKFSQREDGIIVIDIEHKNIFDKFAQKFFKKPKVSHIALDRYGTDLWKTLDGKRTVFDIVNCMKAIYPKEKDRMLDRVVTFLHTLQKNNFIVIKK